MKKTMSGAFRLMAAAGLAMGAASVATAQDTNHMVVISGATLQQNLIIAPAATNDYIDVDGDGLCLSCPAPGNVVDQLAPAGLGPTAAQFFNVQYRAVGSVNGFQELVNWGRTFATNRADFPGPLGVDRGWHNQVTFVQNGAVTNATVANDANPGQFPLRQDLVTLRATNYVTNDTATDGGLRVDIAPLDVPTTWAIQYPGTPSFDRGPTEDGYGTGPTLALNNDGTVFVNTTVVPNRNQDYKQVDASAGGITLAALLPDASFADENTVFDTFFAFAPVAAVTNFGTGLREIRLSELRHLAVAGRLPSGENLVQVTRDAGSGTHNAYMNSLCVDPSWGVGENVGNNQLTGSNNIIAGPLFVPSNKGGSSQLESTAINARLAVSYTGAERGAGTGGWLQTGRLELLAVQNVPGGQFSRPTAADITDNDDNGYIIGGPGVLSTFGDPRAASVAFGGDNPNCPCPNDYNNSGSDIADIDDLLAFFDDFNNGSDLADVDCTGAGSIPDVDDIIVFFQAFTGECVTPNANPAMANNFAAAYINNISRSVEAFESLPSADSNIFSPGEFVASRYIAPTATRFIQVTTDPCERVPNPNFDPTVYDFTRNPAAPPSGAGSVLAQNQYAIFGFASASISGGGRAPAGVVPTRLTGQTYTDGVTGGSTFFRNVSRTRTFSYGSSLPARNAIAGDFNGDNQRNWLDADALVAAWRFTIQGVPFTPVAGPGLPGYNLLDPANPIIWPQPADDMIIEVLGDFNADGNFNSIDVRYFADGLAVDPTTRRLSRVEGFTRVDNAFPGGNFFGTTKATGVAYAAGDSRADIAGNLVTPNHTPIGSDGVINNADLDYVLRQYVGRGGADNRVDWSNTAEAVGSDLSADMNGDLFIDCQDVVTVLNILGTNAGDVNLDGVTNAADLAIITGTTFPRTQSGRANGDLNGDGQVNAADVAIFNNPSSLCN